MDRKIRDRNLCTRNTAVSKRTRQVKNEKREIRTDIERKENLEEWSHEIVDSLHVSTRRVSNCPNIEYPLERLSETKLATLTFEHG
jgi:hypothetical protein